MILDEQKVSKLLDDNKEEKMMETDYKSHNVNVLPAMGGNNGWNNNGNFWEALIAWGIIDRNGNRTGEAVTASQVQALATKFDTTSAEMSNRLNALQISTCEQTSTLKDAVHTASTTNLVGQNALGEKITTIGYKGDSNTKDIEKTILLDGGVTRKNSDDNTNDLKNNQIAGFSSTKDSINGLSAKTSAEHCDIKGLILDNKYTFSKELCEVENRLTTQATLNQSTTMAKLAEIDYNAAIREKDAIIRDKDEKIQEQQFRSLKEDNVEIKKLIHHEHHGHGHGNGTNIDILSDNFSRNIGSAIGNSIRTELTPALNEISRGLNIVIGNTASIGRNNTTGSC